jgi:hypothetical protein
MPARSSNNASGHALSAVYPVVTDTIPQVGLDEFNIHVGKILMYASTSL